MLIPPELLLVRDKANILSQIALSNDTGKGRIEEVSLDVKDQLLNQIKHSPFFSVWCDETADIVSWSQLLLYACFLLVNTIKEEKCHSDTQ